MDLGLENFWAKGRFMGGIKRDGELVERVGLEKPEEAV